MKKAVLFIVIYLFGSLAVYSFIPRLSGTTGHQYLNDTPHVHTEIESIPQGFCESNRETYLLSCHEEDARSRVYEIDPTTFEASASFLLPYDATHTSGLTMIDDSLIAVDYGSNKIYEIDLEASFKAGISIVISTFATDLKGLSACCAFDYEDSQTYLIVTDFQNSKHSYILDWKALKNSNNFRSSIIAKYPNKGLSQGVWADSQYVYETGNSLIFWSALDVYSLDSIFQGNPKRMKRFYLPTMGVQDLIKVEDWFLTTDEISKRFLKFTIKNPES